jgi:aminopeptidase
VIIRGFPLNPIATPLITEVYREVLKAGGHPYIDVDLENIQYIFLTEAAEHQLLHPNPFAKMIAEEFNVDIRIGCDTNTHGLTNVKPEAWQLFGRAYKDSNEALFQRSASGELRWVVSRYPTNAYAQDAEMSLEEFEDFVFSSTFADTEDPIALWKELGRKQQALVDWLAGRKTVLVQGRHADLSFSIEGRTFMNCDGHVNMPDGEICTTPVEDSANGWLESTYPAIHYGVDVGKVTFRFENGIIVRAEAEKNQAHLDKLLATDQGSHRLGEFGIGRHGLIGLSEELVDSLLCGCGPFLRHI